MKYKPMLAEIFTGNIADTKGKYWYEIKFDGGRCIAENNGSSLGTVMWARPRDKAPQSHWNNQFPLVFKSLRKQKQAIFDGELCVFQDGFSKVNLFQKRVHTDNPITIDRICKSIPAVYMVFDILELDGKPLINRPLYERKKILQDILIQDDHIHYVPHYFSHEELMDTENLEGIMLKNPNSLYECKRSQNWLKLKFRLEAELTIVDYEKHASGILMISDTGHRINCNGKMSKIGENLLNKSKTFKIEISYLEMTKEGNYRDPAFKRYLL